MNEKMISIYINVKSYDRLEYKIYKWTHIYKFCVIIIIKWDIRHI